MKKILLVSAIAPPQGGIATWTEAYLKYCHANLIEVDFVNIALSGKRGKQVNNKRNLIDEIERTVRIILEMRKKTKINRKIDIAHINTSCSKFGVLRDYLCVNIAYTRKIPIVLQCHCNVEDQLKNRIAKFVFKSLCKRCSSIIVLNRASLEYLKNVYGIHSQIIPNFIDNQLIVDKHHFNEHVKEIVFVGHVQEKKGYNEIMQVSKMFPQIHFSLVGPINENENINAENNNVTLFGNQEHCKVIDFLNNADIFLFPSHTEGFSVSLIEAMANGLPCIATDVGANRDMIESHGGIIVPVKGIKEIAVAIKSMDDYTIRKKMSQWNIQKVKSNYTKIDVMKKIFSVYNQLEINK